MLDRYKTILKRCEAELIEKKSKFIAKVAPVSNEKEAQDFISEIRKKYSDATHNVSAYQIGERNQIQRYSDDGEPSGTAGKPILDILSIEDIKDTVVVVTRYFGGTLLGTGGLVRAYTKVAKKGLVTASIIEKVLYQKFEVCVDYTLVGKVEYEILKQEHIIKDTIYVDNVKFIVLVLINDKDNFKNYITEITSAQAEIIPIELVYAIWLDGQLQSY